MFLPSALVQTLNCAIFNGRTAVQTHFKGTCRLKDHYCTSYGTNLNLNSQYMRPIYNIHFKDEIKCFHILIHFLLRERKVSCYVTAS